MQKQKQNLKCSTLREKTQPNDHNNKNRTKISLLPTPKGPASSICQELFLLSSVQGTREGQRNTARREVSSLCATELVVNTPAGESLGPHRSPRFIPGQEETVLNQDDIMGLDSFE